MARCSTGKIVYTSKGGAYAALRRINNCALNVYRCPKCSNWHLGNTHDAFRRSQRIDQILDQHEAKLRARLAKQTDI